MKLTTLLCERMALSAKVAEYKKQQKMPVLDRTREGEILQQRKQQGGVYGTQICEIYKKIFEMSRDYQQQLLDAKMKSD